MDSVKVSTHTDTHTPYPILATDSEAQLSKLPSLEARSQDNGEAIFLHFRVALLLSTLMVTCVCLVVSQITMRKFVILFK